MEVLAYIRAKHNLIFKLLLVAFVAFLLSIMLPDVAVKGHRVDDFTTVWSYSDLVTDKDFYVEKTPEELKAERDEIRREAPLFFESVANEKSQKLKNLEVLKISDPKSYQILKPLMDSIYRRGVIETVTGVSPGKLIFVSTGNYAENALYDDFFTIQTAADFLDKNLRSTELDVNQLDFLAINYFLSPQKTNLYENTKLEQLSLYKNVIKAGELLVHQGEELDEEKRNLINKYFDFRNQEISFSIVRFLAKWGLTFILCMVLLVFLAFFRKPIFGQNSQVGFLFLLLLASVFTTYMFHKYSLMILALPFALVPIMVRVFFDGRTALFTHLMLVLLCSFFMADKLEFVLLELVTGIGTLFAVAEMRRRQQILNSAAIIFLFYVFIYITYQLGFGTPQSVTKVISYIPFAISSMLVLLAYPLIYLTEKFFGFISDFKLLELCDLNHPLLRKLSKEVPGTFQHSLQVANLAEEAIYYIGGNSLLVRTGAMYHDIGKLENPYFFTENQPKGFSPHQEIEPIESARIIINHVIAGVELAKKYKLPEPIIDFIRTHHGTTSVRYFYSLFKKQSAEPSLSESQFRYPGPIPFSKETAVLMIADGVEAASRSLKNHDALTINDLVDNIIDYKIAHNQFINSDITFKDITTIKKIFKKRLMNIYHARIEYPA
jgi:cyclic-di-AMP phosphodiesterase PgpH